MKRAILLTSIAVTLALLLTVLFVPSLSCSSRSPLATKPEQPQAPAEGVDGPPAAQETTSPTDWKDIRDSEAGPKRDADRAPAAATGRPAPLGRPRTRIPALGDKPTAGAHFWYHEAAPDGYGGGMMGGMGGMGGYGGEMGGFRDGRLPGPAFIGTPRNVRRPQGSRSTRTPGTAWGRIPVDLAYVTADEIWVIAKAETQPVGTEYDTPGCGAMLAKVEEKEIPLPLKHTDVKGQISGYIATVHVIQQFHNPYDEKIEAVYVFPLPQNAAVNEFVMVIGERRIRGIIRERKEAEQIYREARRQGHVASLLTQERPNIFTQKVANIEPGKEIDVDIKYFNTLAYVDGWYEFVFPMVVGPRFNPPGTTDGVGAVGRGKTGLSGQETEVQYLKPNERSGHDIAVAVDIDAGVEIEEIASPSHAIKNSKSTPQKAHIRLSELDTIPNKDFVLRYKVAGKRIKSALVTHTDERGGFFTLMLYPPDDLRHLKRAPMEMVFVLDCSGSMSGQPIARAKDAVKRALRKLEPDDTFQVIRFSQSASQFGPNPVPATPENVRKAIEYVDALRGGGGTMMIEGVKAALDFPHDPRRFRLVSFLTDGYIGNEAQILGAVHDKLGSSRIFSFGVGSSVNRYLLDRMAKLGKGAVAYVGLNDSSSDIVDRFYDCISHPALTDVEIDWGSLEVTGVYPARTPDLFVGRPLIVTGRFNGRQETTIRVTGSTRQRVENMERPAPGVMVDRDHGLSGVWPLVIAGYSRR